MNKTLKFEIILIVNNTYNLRLHIKIVHSRSDIRIPLTTSKEASIVGKYSRSGLGVMLGGAVEATVFPCSCSY